MDGNNSMKCVDGSGHADECQFWSDYHIPPGLVDKFKYDVAMQRCTYPGTSQEVGASPCEDQDTVCTKHWQAANSVSLENMSHVFEQCGGFISVCCHGLVETLVETKHSGEL